ncbi:hypothetical protein EDB19DRAFT_1666468 [Suillus lakei]|nr:hypothetical protein EDB19DRAFT_1666468 [Suillus lakei]
MVKSPTSAYYSLETCIILITPPPVNTKQWGKPVANIWTQMFDGAYRSEEGCKRYLTDGNSGSHNVRTTFDSDDLSSLLTFTKGCLQGHHR